MFRQTHRPCQTHLVELVACFVQSKSSCCVSPCENLGLNSPRDPPPSLACFIILSIFLWGLRSFGRGKPGPPLPCVAPGALCARVLLSSLKDVLPFLPGPPRNRAGKGGLKRASPYPAFLIPDCCAESSLPWRRPVFKRECPWDG